MAKSANHGGARPGSGRKPGVPNRRTLAEITALREGLSPVDVMLNAMYDAHDRAEQLKQDLSTKKFGKDKDGKREKFELENEYRSQVRIAGQFASDAAPYVHSKLTSTMHTTDPDDPGIGDITKGFASLVASLSALSQQRVPKE